MRGLDKVNCQILNLLQENCRMSLTEIARRVGLSVDSVKKRVDKLTESKTFNPKIQMRPRYFGYDNVVDVKIKLGKYTEEEHKNFITHLLSLPQVVELIEVSGEYDFTLVFIAKDSIEIGNISELIRNKHGDIITKWSESLTTKVYRFEHYNMTKIMGFEE